MNLGNYKISTKILSVIILLGLVSLIITATGILSLRELNTATDKMEISGNEALLGSRMRQNIIALNRAEYRLAADPSPEQIREITDVIKRETEELKQRLDEAMSTAGDQRRELLNKVQENFATYDKELEETLTVARRVSTSVNITAEQRAVLDSARSSRAVANAFEDAALNYVNLVSSQNSHESKQAEKTYKNASLLMMVGSVMGILIGLVMGMLISKRGIVSPMQKIVACLATLADGKLEVDVYGTERRDEVGDIAKTTLVFKENMIKARNLEDAATHERAAKEIRQKKIDAATEKFELSMSDIVKFVASASTELQASAQSLAASAEETSKQSGAVAAASHQASANVQTVASASEELSSSINEIATQVSRSSQVASQAVTDARRAGESVSMLVEAAQKIGDVTKMISAIAEQTNLLALNATIEAARAGDAGKGFAVVAAEVKNLANEATKATEEISAQIAEVQTISQSSADSIQMICRVIEEIDEIAGSISAAIQEQTAATQEISRNVTEAYTGTSEVSQNIGSVSDAANSTGAASHQVLSAADELSRQSTTLKEEFDTFIKAVQAA